jgi:hypothetical protein
MLTLSKCKQKFKVEVDFQPSRYFRLYTLKNGNFIAFYKDDNNKKRLELLDRNFKSNRSFEQLSYNSVYYDDDDDGGSTRSNSNYRLIKIRRKINKMIKFDNIDAVTTHGNQIVLNGSYKSRYFYLTILNEKMRSELHIDCNKSYKSICANSSKIMCLGYNDIIDIYDWNLDNINEIDDFRSAPIVMGIQTINNKLLVRQKKSIDIMNLKTFRIEGVIGIRSYQVILFDNKVHLIVRRGHNRSKCIKFDLEGDYLDDYLIENFDNSSYLLRNGKNKFLFNKRSMEVKLY